jgi:tetratricopeptide (TPR) repeat protein
MSVSILFDGLAEVRAALVGDRQGQLLDSTDTAAMSEMQSLAEITAVVAQQLGAVGAAMGLSGLDTLAIKGPTHSTLAAFRESAFLVAMLDPERSPSPVERILQGWAPEAAVPEATPAEMVAAAEGLPSLEPEATPGLELEPDAEDVDLGGPELSLDLTPAADAPLAPAEPASVPLSAQLRRAVVRGLLADAAVCARKMAEAARSDGAGPPDSLAPAQIEQAAASLLDGVGRVIGGDCLRGQRRLAELIAHRDPSIRWLARHWSGRAAEQVGDLPSALEHARQASEQADLLDAEAKAASLWCSATARAQSGQVNEGLADLAKARAFFDRQGDTWGLGQAWLAEARILADQGREALSTSAALQAMGINPAAEGPRLFLARRALLRQDLGEAERVLHSGRGPEIERERRLIQQIREGAIVPDAVADFLRAREMAPGSAAVRLLLKIARGSPRFSQAREVLGWMLLKLGKYNDAGAIFRGMLALELSPSERASVDLGLGCIADAAKADSPIAPAESSPAEPSPAEPQSASAAAAALSSSLIQSAMARSGSSRLNTVFSGELSVFPLPDLLEFLRSGRRSGTLICSCQAGIGTLHFFDGKITGAASPGTPVIGKLLVLNHGVEEKALLQVVVTQQSERLNQPIGWLLVQEGLVEASVVRASLQEQIVMALREMVAWHDGQFAFDSKVAPERARPEIDVEIDPQGVLLKIFRELDEASASRPSKPVPEGDEL